MLRRAGYDSLQEFQLDHPGYLGLMTVGDVGDVQAIAQITAGTANIYVLIATSVQPTVSGGKLLVELTQERLDHIVIRHWWSSSATGAGKWGEDFGARQIRDLIADAVTKGASRPNTRGRPGLIFEYDCGKTIGVNSSGNATSLLRVVVMPNGKVWTAFPY
jgi:hypothetical protein